MKICPKCKLEHNRPGIYCSKSCACRDRTMSDETRERIRTGYNQYIASMTPAERQKRAQEKRAILAQNQDAAQQARRNKNNAVPFDLLKWDAKRKRVITEQANKCGECGLSEWRDKPLPLEVDHRDGDRANNTRENLIGICPNCHSITPTWRGRNIPRKKVSDEVLKKALEEQGGNIRQALLQVGMAAKGANYDRAKKLLD